MSKTLKTISIVCLVLGTIGAIMTSNVLGQFSFTLFLSSFISLLILAVVLYAIAIILDNQESIARTQTRLLEELTAIQKSTPSAPAAPQAPSAPAPLSKPSPSGNATLGSVPTGYWKCKSCGKLNPTSRKSCLECGSAK